MKLSVPVCTACLILAALAAPAEAHHSYAMFDRTKTDTVQGVVKEFEMIQPHGWLHVMVTDPQGKAREWALETAGPSQLGRQGWTDKTVTAGDKVTVELHPLKDGSNGGQLVSVKLPNGQTLGTQFR